MNKTDLYGFITNQICPLAKMESQGDAQLYPIDYWNKVLEVRNTK